MSKTARLVARRQRVQGCVGWVLVTTALWTLVVPRAWSEAQSVVEPDSVVVKLTASDAEGGERFGAAVSVSGGTVLIGAPLDDGVGLDSGSAYVFQRAPGEAETWNEMVKLVAADAEGGALFGAAVDVSGDTALVGAPLSGSELPTGAAYLFQRLGSNWFQLARLAAQNLAGGEQFGAAVALSGDFALVGAPFDDLQGRDSGAAFLYHRNRGGANNWGLVARLDAPDAAISDNFGFSVALAADAAVVGAPLDDDKGLDSGSAYLFQMGHQRPFSLTSVTKLTAPDGSSNDRFGHAVALSRDAVLIGSRWGDDNGFNSGKAYVYQRGPETVQEPTKITPKDGDVGDWFGGAVAVSAGRLVVGAELDDDMGSSSGSGYVFERGEEEALWAEVQKLIAPDGEAQDSFGGAVDLSSSLAVIGAREDDDAADNAGSAYLFRFPGLSLAVVGTCPGVLTLEVAGATAREGVTLLVSQTPGDALVDNGDCAGTQLGLREPRIVSSKLADEEGQIYLERAVRSGSCGLYLQVVDNLTCQVSNIVVLPSDPA